MKCERCKSFMLEEEIVLSVDSSKRRSISAWHCIYCGRSEYGTMADKIEGDAIID